MIEFLAKFKQSANSLILSLENEKTALINYWITFFFILEIRFFIESYSTTENYFNFSTQRFLFDIIHYNLSFIVLALLFIFIFHYATKTSVENTIRVVLPSFILILLAPFFDLLFTQGKGSDIYYLGPWENINILMTYLTYFKLGGFEGASLGIQLEALIALSAGFIYFRVKNCSTSRSLFFIWICYTTIFIWACAPFFIKWFLEITNIDKDFLSHYDSVMMTEYYLFIISPLILFLFYLTDKKLFLSVLLDIRFFRILNYEFLFLFGIILAYTKANSTITTALFLQTDIFLNTLFCMIAILFSGLFSIAMNNVAENHKISHYKILGFTALGIAFFYAAIVGIKVLLIICFINANNYINNIPPLQLKRFFFFPKCIIAVNSTAILILSYIVVLDNHYLFPYELFWIILIGFTVAAFMTDLNEDTFQLKSNILSLKKKIIGFGVLLTSISFYCVMQNKYLIYVLALFGICQYILLNKKNFKEWQVLIFYYASLVFLTMGLWFKWISVT